MPNNTCLGRWFGKEEVGLSFGEIKPVSGAALAMEGHEAVTPPLELCLALGLPCT